MLKPNNDVENAESGHTGIDFDEWMALYQSDPEAFEHRREALIQKTINNAPEEHQRRLNGLQFQVDMERRRSDSPLQSCMQISSMMWERFDDLRAKLNQFQQQEHGVIEAPVERPEPTKAKVLEFAPK